MVIELQFHAGIFNFIGPSFLSTTITGLKSTLGHSWTSEPPYPQTFIKVFNIYTCKKCPDSVFEAHYFKSAVFKTRQNSCSPARRLTFLIFMQLYADMMKSYLSYRAPCPPTRFFARCRAGGRALFSTLMLIQTGFPQSMEPRSNQSHTVSVLHWIAVPKKDC